MLLNFSSFTRQQFLVIVSVTNHELRVYVCNDITNIPIHLPFSDGVNDTRPKSLAVCSPTKLLTLEEAQARGQARGMRYLQLGNTFFLVSQEFNRIKY